MGGKPLHWIPFHATFVDIEIFVTEILILIDTNLIMNSCQFPFAWTPLDQPPFLKEAFKIQWLAKSISLSQQVALRAATAHLFIFRDRLDGPVAVKTRRRAGGGVIWGGYWVLMNRFVYLSIYIPWPFPPVWGVADNTKETTKQWGFHSVLLAMTRDPAEFGWHCWSNTDHPPPSSTTYIAS